MKPETHMRREGERRMEVEVKLHDIGEGIMEGEISQFHVRPGDRVQADDPVVEVMTDKVTTELPAPASGVVKSVLVGEGDVIPVGTTILTIEVSVSEGNVSSQSNGSVARSGVDFLSHDKVRIKSNELDGGSSQRDSQDIAVSHKTRVLASPATRKLAREQGVPLDEVVGTAPGGRITHEDVWRYVEERSRHADQGDHSFRPIRPACSLDRVPSSVSSSGNATEIPFKGRRRQIARKMVQSLTTIPHVSHFDEADVTRLLEWKEGLKRIDPDNARGLNVSIAAVLIKAVALTLKQFPILNAQLDEDKGVIRLLQHIHIGVATDTEDGLVVPVIQHADEKSITAIHREMKALIQKAQHDQLSPAEMKGSTFTVSNVGPLGSTGATPIINYPEVGLMAFHKTRRLPVVCDKTDEIVIRSMMNITLSFDHRVMDGGKAVAFTNAFIERIRSPEAMFVELR